MPQARPPRAKRSTGPHPFLRGRTWWIRVPRLRSPALQRSLNTDNKKRAIQLATMLRLLAGEQRWDLLTQLETGAVSFAEVYAAWSKGTLHAFERDREAAANDTDLLPLVSVWHADLVRIGTASADKYRRQLHTLIGEQTTFPLSRFTTPVIDEWLSTKKPATEARYRAAAASFAAFLLRRDVLKTNPMVGLAKVKQSRTRVVYLTPQEAVAALNVLPPVDRALHAFLMSTGADLGPALATSRNAIKGNQVEFRRGKTWDRERACRFLFSWARPVFEAYMRTLDDAPPDAPLFAALLPVDRRNGPLDDLWYRSAEAKRVAAAVYRTFQVALAKVGITGYSTRDSRHTFAVNALKEGYGYPLVARQLGHANTRMAHERYAKFVPDDSEYVRRTKLTLPEPGLLNPSWMRDSTPTYATATASGQRPQAEGWDGS